MKLETIETRNANSELMANANITLTVGRDNFPLAIFKKILKPQTLGLDLF